MDYSKKKIMLPIISERFLMTVLKVLCGLFNISKKSIHNVERLLGVIDMDHYSKDLNINSLIQSILIVCKHKQQNAGKLDRDQIITEIDVTLGDQYNNQKKNLIIPTINNGLVSESEVKMVNTTIELYLKYSAILLSKEKVYKVLTEFSSGDINNIMDSVTKYRNIITNISEEFKRSDNIDLDVIVHSTDEDYMNIILESYESVKNPKFSLNTGLKMFNSMLSEQGGFLIPSYVIIYASINSFKSALLQYCTEWIRRYNSDKFIKQFEETGKIPTILKYSFENTRREDGQREFIINTGKQLKDIKDEDELKKMWKESHNDNSIIDVATVYAEAGTVRVSDMRKEVKGLEDLGYKVFAVVIDYLELIRAEDEDIRSDNRLKLGAISNALHMMSINDELLVLTAQQMNRSAEMSMSDLRQKTEANIIRQIGGRQFIGESYAIDKPADFSMYIALERSVYDNKLFLTIKRDKCRMRRSNVDYFVHEIKQGFYLEPDFNTDKILSLTEIAPPQGKIKDTNKEKYKEYNGSLGASSLRNIMKDIIKNYNDSDYINNCEFTYLSTEWKDDDTAELTFAL